MRETKSSVRSGGTYFSQETDRSHCKSWSLTAMLTRGCEPVAPPSAEKMYDLVGPTVLPAILFRFPC